MSDAVAVTGATGFIGGRLIERLSDAGIPVRALHRGARDLPILPHVHWVKGSLEVPDSLDDLLAGVDAVVHCAGSVRGTRERQFARVNVEGVHNLVLACGHCEAAPRLLHISTLAATAPDVSAYAATKRAGEAVVEASEGLRWTIFRPPAVYGPGDRELAGLFRAMARGLGLYPGSLDSRVSMIHVDDLVGAIVAWLQRGDADGRLFELDDGRRGGYTWLEILETMERVTGRRLLRIRIPKSLMMAVGYLNLSAATLVGGTPMLTPGKVRELFRSAWVADAREIEAVLSWHPRVSLEDGLRELLETFA